MPGVTQVQTTLNGEVVNFLWNPSKPFLGKPRDILGMTGKPKGKGFNDGNCGPAPC
ncbi:MAG: hypothetical protein Ct9H300mP11_25400 [Chloroflexota bacterium]|nr:MAG: hypothetical protein Ct9H300mP11_25400 [Chloroflexota bacterium]